MNQQPELLIFDTRVAVKLSSKLDELENSISATTRAYIYANIGLLNQVEIDNLLGTSIQSGSLTHVDTLLLSAFDQYLQTEQGAANLAALNGNRDQAYQAFIATPFAQSQLRDVHKSFDMTSDAFKDYEAKTLLKIKIKETFNQYLRTAQGTANLAALNGNRDQAYQAFIATPATKSQLKTFATTKRITDLDNFLQTANSADVLNVRQPYDREQAFQEFQQSIQGILRSIKDLQDRNFAIITRAVDRCVSINGDTDNRPTISHAALDYYRRFTWLLPSDVQIGLLQHLQTIPLNHQEALVRQYVTQYSSKDRGLDNQEGFLQYLSQLEHEGKISHEICTYIAEHKSVLIVPEYVVLVNNIHQKHAATQPLSIEEVQLYFKEKTTARARWLENLLKLRNAADLISFTEINSDDHDENNLYLNAARYAHSPNSLNAVKLQTTIQNIDKIYLVLAQVSETPRQQTGAQLLMGRFDPIKEHLTILLNIALGREESPTKPKKIHDGDPSLTNPNDDTQTGPGHYITQRLSGIRTSTTELQVTEKEKREISSAFNTLLLELDAQALAEQLTQFGVTAEGGGTAFKITDRNAITYADKLHDFLAFFDKNNKELYMANILNSTENPIQSWGNLWGSLAELRKNQTIQSNDEHNYTVSSFYLYLLKFCLQHKINAGYKHVPKFKTAGFNNFLNKTMAFVERLKPSTSASPKEKKLRNDATTVIMNLFETVASAQPLDKKQKKSFYKIMDRVEGHSSLRKKIGGVLIIALTSIMVLICLALIAVTIAAIILDPSSLFTPIVTGVFGLAGTVGSIFGMVGGIKLFKAGFERHGLSLEMYELWQQATELSAQPIEIGEVLDGGPQNPGPDGAPAATAIVNPQPVALAQPAAIPIVLTPENLDLPVAPTGAPNPMVGMFIEPHPAGTPTPRPEDVIPDPAIAAAMMTAPATATLIAAAALTGPEHAADSTGAPTEPSTQPPQQPQGGGETPQPVTVIFTPGGGGAF